MSDNNMTQCVLFADIFPKPAVLQFDQRQGSSDGGPTLLTLASSLESWETPHLLAQ